MRWIALAFALELGMVPMSSLLMYDPPTMVQEQPEFYQQFEAEVLLFGYLALGGSVTVYEWKIEDQLRFFSYRGGFEIGAELRLEPVKIGWRHYCTHPIVPYLSTVAQKIKWEGAYEEIYIRMEGRTK